MSQVVLTIGGSDSGGGAGIQADLKTFSALGLHGTCVITAITAQNTLGVQQIFGQDPDAVIAQLKSVTDDFSVSFAKTGMLHASEIVVVVAEFLEKTGIPFVLDPVIEAEAGGNLLNPEALQAAREHLIPIASVVTPNIFEAQALTGIYVRDISSAKQAAREIMNLGPGAVIVKGGHLDCTDLLVEGNDFHLLSGKRVDGQNHGVGCTYSAALASFLASGSSLVEAASCAKKFAEESLRGSMRVGKGVGPVNQTASLREEANRFRVLCDMQKALDLLRDERLIYEIIPDAASSIGMAIPGASSPDDVASFDGELAKMGLKVCLSGCIKFGSSSLLGRVILEEMRHDPEARAAINLDLDSLPASTAQKLAAIKIDHGRRYRKKENVYRLVGSCSTQVAGQAVKLARILGDRKI